MKEITIYTDGGCEPNPGKGTWAFVCREPYKEQTGYEAVSTSNRMEILGVINAIEYGLSVGAERVNIFSDSQYVVKGFNEWMHNWQRLGWQKKGSAWAGGFEPVKNVELWKRLFLLKDKAKLTWVRGHNGDPMNELCDTLVRSTYAEVFGGKMKH